MVASIDEYISTFSEPVQGILEQLRARIRAAVPGAVETISYQIPTLSVAGRSVVSYAGWRRHVSLYPVPAVDEALETEIARYRSGNSTLRFRFDQPIPYDLIGRVVGLLAAQRGATKPH